MFSDPRIVTWILILFGVILTQALLLNLEFHHRAKGYLLRAATWIWEILLLICLSEIVIAGAFVEFGARLIPLLKQPPLPFIIGMFVVLVLRGIEELVFYRNFSEEKIMSWFARLLRDLHLAVAHKFAGAVKTRMEQDVFDWQNQSEKLFNLKAEEFRRRIRKVYACHVEEVALLRGDPGLLFRDAGFSPYPNLYILAEHLGRKRLIRELQTVNLEWKGDENRRERGKIEDRVEPGGIGRFYDNKDLIKRINEQRDKNSEPPSSPIVKNTKDSKQKNPRKYSSAKERYKNQDKYRWRKALVWLIPLVFFLPFTLMFITHGAWFVWSVALTADIFLGYTWFLLEWHVWKTNPARDRGRYFLALFCIASALFALAWRPSFSITADVPKTIPPLQSSGVTPSPSSLTPVEEMLAKREVLDIDPENLLAFFEKYDEAQANTQVEPYLGKWMELSARVTEIERHSVQPQVVGQRPATIIDVTLRSSRRNDPKGNSMVTRARFDDQKWMERAFNLTRNKNTKVRGQIKYIYPYGFHLEHCEIIE